jgi:hypothetical protein
VLRCTTYHTQQAPLPTMCLATIHHSATMSADRSPQSAVRSAAAAAPKLGSGSGTRTGTCVLGGPSQHPSSKQQQAASSKYQVPSTRCFSLPPPSFFAEGSTAGAGAGRRAVAGRGAKTKTRKPATATSSRSSGQLWAALSSQLVDRGSQTPDSRLRLRLATRGSAVGQKKKKGGRVGAAGGKERQRGGPSCCSWSLGGAALLAPLPS